MKILNREEVKRIVGQQPVAAGGGGGGDFDPTVLNGYATELWVDENYISIEFFSRLFQAHGTENGVQTDIDPNDMDSTITSIEAMMGFWTDYYLSALGNGGGLGSTLYLSSLADVLISSPANNQVLTYNSSTGKWVNANPKGGVTDLASLTDVTLSTPAYGDILLYDGTKWINSALKTINSQSLIGSGDISVGGGASGNYLPLTGGTLTNASFGGALVIKRDGTTSSVIRYSNNNGVLGALGFYSNGELCYWEGTNTSGSSRIPLATQSWANGQFLPLAGGTMTGNITMTAAGVVANSTKIKWGSSYLSGNSNNVISARLSGTAEFTVRPISNTSIGLSVNSEKVNVEHVLNVYGVDATSKRGIRIHKAGSNSTIYFGCTTDDSDDEGMWTLDLNTSYGIRLRGTSSTSGTSRSNYMVIAYGGNVGIGITSPSYKLHVSGNIYATGAVTALSDARKKDVQGDAKIGVEQIADAPAVQFLWKDEERRKEGVQVGTLAQYWQAVLPEVVMDKGGELSMQYGVAALVSAIITARKVVDHERRISELEKENERLRTEVEQLRLN